MNNTKDTPSFYTWKDVVRINGKNYCEEFPISGKRDLAIFHIDDFLEAVATKYKVDIDDIKTYMIDGIGFNCVDDNLQWGAEACGAYVGGEEWFSDMSIIDEFTDDYGFLSNYSYSPITYEGIHYKSVEAAFQAAKTTSLETKKRIAKMKPSEAKKRGRTLALRPDWEQVKVDIMTELVTLKFATNPELKEELLNTQDWLLVEGNWWNDTFWGVCNGKGENHLGEILMEVRENLR